VGEFDSSDPIRTLNITTKFEITVSWITNQIFSFSSRVVDRGTPDGRSRVSDNSVMDYESNGLTFKQGCES
jgi:hypothetical protein